MRIFILNYEFPPVGGGGGRVSADVGIGLAARGHQVSVLTAHLGHLPREEHRDGMTIRRVSHGRRRAERCTVPEMAGFVGASLLPACRFVRRWRPDVMHVHFAVPTGWVAWLSSLFCGVPYVLTVHLGDVPGGVPAQTDHLFRFVKPLTIPIWRRAAAVTAVSSFVASLAEEAYGIRPQVIFNGIDLSRFPSHRDGVARPVRLLWVGRIQSQKNLPYGLRQLAGVADLEWTLDVVGDGPERADAERAADQAGLSARIRFLGWIEEEEVRDLMCRADILYLPSRSEGLSLVSLEALASGLAIVGSRVGGLQTVVEQGVNGFLCPLEDATAFQQALRKVIADLPLLGRMQQASLQLARKFSLEHRVEEYEAVLRRAAGEPVAS